MNIMSLNITLDDIRPCLLDDKSVMITLTNYGYISYTRNMLKSLKPFDLDKKIFIICMDDKSAQELSSDGYHVYNMNASNFEHFIPWNEKGYDHICYFKLVIMYQILSLSKNLLYIDGDIVFLKSPLQDLLTWQADTEHEVWIQNDGISNNNTTNVCAGYVYIKSTETTIYLYNCLTDTAKARYKECTAHNNDQTYFNLFIKPYCKTVALPLEHYPNGNIFYAFSEQLSKTAVMVHFNWIVGHAKVEKMKKHNLWLLTDEETPAEYKLA